VRARILLRRQDEDIRDQIDAHLDEAADEYVRQGLSPEDARRAARLNFGSVVTAEEACRDVGGPWHRDVSKDVLLALRMLHRNPGFAVVAVLSLALGIAANSAIFTIVNAMLLRPRPFANPQQVVELYVGERQQPYETTSYPSYIEFRERNEVFTGLAAYGIRQFRLGDANEVEQVWGEAVSSNYFDVIGVRASAGRTFTVDEDVAPGRNPVVVIGHRLWQRRFHSDPNLIGQAVAINNQKLTVVGIAPPDYPGIVRGLSSEVFVPTMMMPALEPASGAAMLTRRSRWLAMLGRLAPGTTLEHAQARFELLSREMQSAHPDEWRSIRESGSVRELFVAVLPEHQTRVLPDLQVGAYAIAALMAVIVNLVLAVACVNLANMLLSRAVARRREIAVRLALGASRFRIVRQLLAESILLSLIAGAIGVVLAVWWLDLLLAFMPALPEGIRLALDLQVDWRALVYTGAFSTATGLLFGLAPALRSSRTDVSGVLKDDSGAIGGGLRKSRLRAALVVTQVAFSLLLLIAAALVLRSLDKVRPTRLGFSSEEIVVASLTLDEPRYNRARGQEFYRRLTEQLFVLPGVQAVSLVDGVPGGFMGRSRRGTEIEGYQASPGESLEIDANIVGPHYFTNLRMPIVQGRDFDERDREGAPCVAVVNEAFARRYFRGGSPLGKHVAKFDESGKQMCGIVGVVQDDRWQSLQAQLRPFYWLALQQSHRRRVAVLVHVQADPASHIGAIRRSVQALDPIMPVNDIQTLSAYHDSIAYPFRMIGIVFGASGLMALALATIGIYGVVSYSVAQRTREVGIRMALGALRAQILAMVVGQGMALVAWGLAVGVLLSFALTRILASSLFFDTELLFGVTATDPLTFAGVTMLLAVVSLVACSVPALRATRVDPIEALRYE
jgi:predicted permease